MADCRKCLYSPGCTKKAYAIIENIIDDTYDVNVPCDIFKDKADFMEVKHGEWKFINLATNYLEAPFGDTCHCSVCGFHIDVSDTHFKYCPECGARMDGNNLVKEMEGNDNA